MHQYTLLNVLNNVIYYKRNKNGGLRLYSSLK